MSVAGRPDMTRGPLVRQLTAGLALFRTSFFCPCHFCLPLFRRTRPGGTGKVKVARGSAGPRPIRSQPPPPLTLSPKVLLGGSVHASPSEALLPPWLVV